MIEAEDVMEPPAYLGSFKYKNLEDMEKGLRGCFTIPFFVAFENLITAMTHTVYIVTRPENFDILREKTHQIPVATVEEAWELAKKQLAEEGKTDYSINIIPHGSAIVPFLKNKRQPMKKKSLPSLPPWPSPCPSLLEPPISSIWTKHPSIPCGSRGKPSKNMAPWKIPCTTA